MQCESETWERAGNCDTRCIRDDGHEGDHTDGCLTWREMTRAEMNAEYDRLDAEYARIDASYELLDAERAYGQRDVWQAGALAFASLTLLLVVLSLRAC